MKRDEIVILGIDPGTNVMGYGAIACRGNATRMLEMGIVKLNKISDPFEKLQRIYHESMELFRQFRPTEAAIEEPFFGKNVQSMLKLGRAQGMAIAASIQSGIPIYQYAPRTIKKSITGNGNASKEQVAQMLFRLLTIQDAPEKLDATDGLAVALCHRFQNGNLTDTSAQRHNSWESFITQNPGRVK